MDAPALPSNVEIETALLGSLLLNNDAYSRVASFLKPEHFYDPLLSRIFALCEQLIQSGQVADPRTIKSFLNAEEKVGDITIGELIGRIASEAVTISGAEHYGKAIRDLSMRRKMVEIARDAEAAALDAEPDKPVTALLEEIEGDFATLRDGHKVASLTFSPSAAVKEAMDLIDAAHAGRRVGWPYMLPEFGSVMDGSLQPGQLYGLLGASGEGKTSFVLQQLRFSAEQGIPFLFLSGEQERAICVLQMQAQALGIPLTRMIEKKGITEGEADRLFEDGQALAKLPWAIEKWTACTVAKLGVKIRAFVKRYGPGIVAIDHVRKIVPDQPKGILAEQVFQVYDGVKDVVFEAGCAGILLMQRNSDFLKRRNMEPIRSDCYGGEGCLNALDGCLTLYQPTRWLKQAAKRAERDSDRRRLEDEAVHHQGQVWISNLKNRFGPAERSSALKFKAEFTRFVSEAQERAAIEPELDGMGWGRAA